MYNISEGMVMKRFLAELSGTFILVLFGVGSAVALSGTPYNSVGTAFAFGLGFVVAYYIISKISGCHLNPAVSLAFLINKRIKFSTFWVYFMAQLIGSIIACLIILFGMSQCNSSYFSSLLAGCNGFADLSPIGITLGGALIVETIATSIFVLVVLCCTSKDFDKKYSGWIIGAALVVVHLFLIPITGTSVNPARSFGPALIFGIALSDFGPLSQVWLFFVSSVIGAILSVWVYNILNKAKKSQTSNNRKTSKSKIDNSRHSKFGVIDYDNKSK